jgi:hypothetical protein
MFGVFASEVSRGLAARSFAPAATTSIRVARVSGRVALMIHQSICLRALEASDV